MAGTTVEVLIPEKSTETALAMLQALNAAINEAGDSTTVTAEYQGGYDFLVMYGVGRPPRSDWRDAQIANGGRVMLCDLGYVGRAKITGYLRVSINQDHPQEWMNKTPSDPGRWKKHRIKLREDYDPTGPIILAGLGRKSWVYYKDAEWETRKLKDLRDRFQNNEIIYRPKPGSPALNLDCRINEHSTFEELLRGASLVVCRQSNVAVDAAIAGVPFWAEDGAAMWLQAKPFTRTNRLDFLYRLAHWQYRPDEAAQAWRFVKEIASN